MPFVLTLLALVASSIAFHPITVPNRALLGHVYRLYDLDWINCIQSCQDDPKCFSYNFVRLLSGLGQCQMIDCGFEGPCNTEGLVFSTGSIFQQIAPTGGTEICGSSLQSHDSKAACNIDLGLVMDNTKGNFSLIKDFARQLVSKFQISDEGTHVGAITFGKTAGVRLLFSDLKGSTNDLQNVKKQIDSWHEGPLVNNKHTSISEALRVAKDFLFTTAGGMRSGPLEQVLVLFTNGKQEKGRLASTLSETQELQSKGIKLITVGIRPKPDSAELVKIATNKSENVHLLKTPDRIEIIAKQIVQSACSKE